MSSVGNLKRDEGQKQTQLFQYQSVGSEKQIFKVKKLQSGKGKIYPYKPPINTENLKKGGRKELQRDNLTKYAKQTIRDAGNVMAYLVENDARFMSSLMLTLTYGKLAPEHKTAKRHLNAFLTLCRKHGYLSHYVWVAQLQTGKRAAQKGLKSYRQEHGAAIHFHILFMTTRGSDLQLRNAQRVLRPMWTKIVNDWERKQTNSFQEIGGANIKAVYDASKYISTYISNEESTIIGNMWGMSSQMRKEIQPIVELVKIPIRDFDTLSKRVSIKRQYRTNAEGKQERIREVSAKTIAVKNWDESWVICTNEIDVVLAELRRIEKNRNTIKIEDEKELCLL